MAAVGKVLKMQGLGVRVASAEASVADAQARLGKRAGVMRYRSAVERVCNHHVIYRGMQCRRKGNGRHQTSAKYCAALCPKIVTPYPRRREINCPDHVAAFKVERRPKG
jgi:hypothetical protein